MKSIFGFNCEGVRNYVGSCLGIWTLDVFSLDIFIIHNFVKDEKDYFADTFILDEMQGRPPAMCSISKSKSKFHCQISAFIFSMH